MSTLIVSEMVEQRVSSHQVSNSGFQDSALEMEAEPQQSLRYLVADGTAVRRRASDFSHLRPTDLKPTDLKPTPAIELVPIQSASADKMSILDAEDSPVQNLELDVELAPVSQSTTAAVLGNSISTAPILITTAQKAAQRRWSRIHFAAMCWSFFLAGWNDGSTGPLLPTIQRSHHIGFAIVSMLFVVSTIGFVVGAISNVYLNAKYGFGKMVVLGSVSSLIAYALLAAGGPFPLMCAAFAFTGFGQALQITQVNSFVGSLQERAPTMLGLLHASYGLGAFTAPLVATHFASQAHWSFHYLFSLGFAVLNTASFCAVFRFKTSDAIRIEAGQAVNERNSSASGSEYKQIMGLRAVHFLACWALIYVGVEVTLGGWIVTFIQQRRDGGASAGYISSGFFGGLMMGRIILMWLNQKIGEHRVMFMYAVLAIVLEVTIWIVPSLIENAIAVSCIGLLLGPMYPILVHHSSLILPRWLFTGCMGWITGIGQAGSAVLPFVTGLLASRFGISSLQPFIVSMMSSMILLWAFVPKVRRID